MNFRTILMSGALAVTPMMSSAATDTLSNLVGGATLVEGDVTFSGFTFLDVFSSVPVDPSTITVSTAATASTVDLVFSFDPILEIVNSPGNEFNSVEFESVFDLAVSSSRNVISTTATLNSFDFAVPVFAAIQVQQADDPNGADTLLNTAVSDSSSGNMLSETSVLAPTQSLTHGWDVQLEAEGAFASAELNQFTLSYGFDSAVSASVPLPAGLPLLLAGLGGLMALRRRSA